MGIFDGMNDIFGVGNTISQSSNTQPDDVLKTKSALAQTGHYQVPNFGITDIPDMGMIDGLKGFQQDNGLKVDGVMKPGGPTEAKLGETLSNQGMGNMDLLEQAKPKKPKIDPLTGVKEIKMPKLNKPTKAQWDQVAEMQKPKQTPWFRSPKIQPVADEAHSANTRTMDSLLKYSANGSLPYLYADSIKNGGDKAVNEYANFMQQLNDRKGDRVETFHQEVMDRLSKTHKQKFATLEVQDDRHETPRGQDHGNEHAQWFQTASHQSTEDTEAGPSLYRTTSAETSHSQPTTTAVMVEKRDDAKNTQDRSYDKAERKFSADTNEELFADDGYRELDFDLKGDGQYDFAIWNPLDGYEANNLHKEAVEKVKELYKGQRTARDDEADAFRHAYWSYRATQKIGAKAAKQAGDGHEITKPNEDGERLMDLYNNKIGRELALDPKNKDRDPVEVIQEAIANGKLRKRPFRLRGQKNQLRLPWQ